MTEGKREMSDSPVATSTFPPCPDQSVGFKERKYMKTMPQKSMTGHMTFFFLSQINGILNKSTECAKLKDNPQ